MCVLCFQAHFEQFDHPDLKNVKKDMVDPADEEAKNESVQDAGESEDEEDAGGEAAAGLPQLKRGISIEVNFPVHVWSLFTFNGWCMIWYQRWPKLTSTTETSITIW